MNPSPENSHLLGYSHAQEIGFLQSEISNTQIMGLLSKFFSNARKPDGMHTYTPEEIRHHLTNVGFRDLDITVNEEKRWLCTTARK